MLITPEQALAHLRATADDADMILIYTEAAEQSAVAFLNRQVYADAAALDAAVLAGTAGTSPMVINAALKAAMLLTLGHLYANREDVVIDTTSSELPHGSRALLASYRQGMGA